LYNKPLAPCDIDVSFVFWTEAHSLPSQMPEPVSDIFDKIVNIALQRPIGLLVAPLKFVRPRDWAWF
jgi:hypothetical protein